MQYAITDFFLKAILCFVYQLIHLIILKWIVYEIFYISKFIPESVKYLLNYKFIENLTLISFYTEYNEGNHVQELRTKNYTKIFCIIKKNFYINLKNRFFQKLILHIICPPSDHITFV